MGGGDAIISFELLADGIAQASRMAGMTHGRRQWASLPGSREARGRHGPDLRCSVRSRPFDPARAAGPATAGETINHPLAGLSGVLD